LGVIFACHMRQIHAGCVPHPRIRRKCYSCTYRARSAQHGPLIIGCSTL
jgi:hypothetical protein